MQINLFQVDAFTEKVFTGNPAAVCPLDFWLEDDVLQNIAQANNLSETAFFVPAQDKFQLRWFTPTAEVDLCGHATLAAAHVIFKHLAYAKEQICFSTKSGDLQVKQSEDGLQMDFPASMPKAIDAPLALLNGLGISPKSVLAAFDYIVELADQQQVVNLEPDLALFKTLDLRGVVVTAPGDEVDFVSRCFFPKIAVDEDPVTGSAHCELGPFWANKLAKNSLTAKQLSARTGKLRCKVQGPRVTLTGRAVDYMQGIISI